MRIGYRFTDLAAGAVRYPHLGVGHGCALIQRGYPGHGIFAAQFEMHAQIGHQRRGADHHRPGIPMAFIQQRRAQPLRADFQHMKACRQRYSDHFKRPSVVADGFGQVQGFDIGLATQQRQHAGLHLVLVIIVYRFGQWPFDIARSNLARHREIVITLHLQKPLDDVSIGAGCEGADLAGIRWQGDLGLFDLESFGGQHGFHIAQCDRQHGHTIGFGKTLHDAKRSCGKFC